MPNLASARGNCPTVALLCEVLMSIDLTTEQALSLTEARKVLPTGRNGSRPHISTLMRWILDGVKSPNGETIRLRAARLGSKWVTSKEALSEFMDALTPEIGEAQPTPRADSKRR